MLTVIYSGTKCTDCDDEYSQITHVANVEGFYEYQNTATCTRAGVETYTCTLEGCGNVERHVSPMGNHTVEEYTSATEPTCTQAGSKKGVCTTCKETVTVTVPALGHTNEYVETLDNTAEDGHTYVVEKCTVCGDQTLTPTHVDWVDGHFTSTVVTKPTCTLNGVQIDRCTICSSVRNVTLEANGEHVWYVTSTTEPTCTSAGKIYYACENCNMTKSENIDALGHNYVPVPESSVAPTCTAAGYDLSKCSVCGAVKKDVISAVGHIPDEETYTVLSEATCEKDGSATATCKACGIAMDNIVIAALGHDYANVVTNIEDKPGHSLSTPTCQRCGNTDVSSILHKEWLEGYFDTKVITEGSCTIARVERDTCTLCGETRTNTTQATGHSNSFSHFDDSTGNLVYICSKCNTSTTRTPATVLLSWNSRYINKTPADVTSGYIFELTGDDFINAKNYGYLVQANKIYQQIRS